jgi:hypothetical protein
VGIGLFVALGVSFELASFLLLFSFFLASAFPMQFCSFPGSSLDRVVGEKLELGTGRPEAFTWRGKVY